MYREARNKHFATVLGPLPHARRQLFCGTTAKGNSLPDIQVLISERVRDV